MKAMPACSSLRPLARALPTSRRPSGAPIGQIRSLDRSHLLRFMHIFQKRKELPFDRGGGGGGQGGLEEAGKGKRGRKCPSVRPRICMHAGSSSELRGGRVGEKEGEEKNRAICFRFTYLAREERPGRARRGSVTRQTEDNKERLRSS